MKVNNKRLQKLILDTQKSVGQLSKLAYETGVQDGLLKANALNALKPLDNTSMRWIPCSERLPEDVEIGEEYPTVIFCTIDETYCGFLEYTEHGRTWWNADAEYEVDEVIAWMPLPEPYKENNDQ